MIQHQVTQQRLVFRVGVGQFDDRLARDDQHMHRCLRVNIADRHAVFVLVDKLRGDLTAGDLAEYGVFHRASSQAAVNPVFHPP